ncbi:hypothetical protein [Haloplasma contractile]|uniref:Alcohol acetyltransferase n=1 Tax=Haloplasma contractile SSD-17B TaxID=1033810 RepID=F7PZN2_9MOLU|nr:hypothetical protein [Haloplasma contractile]ERJ13283.1 hypothetical protein HLPCO_000912 [Haloplasma contractile SSD-17B]
MRKSWFKLDNAAKIFSHVDSDYITTVFRMSHVLNQTIDPEVLKRALDEVMDYFYYFKVKLKKGLFWYYLEDQDAPLKLFKDEGPPCRRIISNDTNGYLFRVLYTENTISCEFHHLLSDGTGCLTFLNTLVTKYAELLGIPVDFNEMNRDYHQPVNEAEAVDSYRQIAKHHPHVKPKIEKEQRVFHIKGHIVSSDRYFVTTATLPLADLYQLAKSYDTKVTEFLAALYLQTFLEIQDEQVKVKRRHKPVALQLPINLRRRLPSESLRNFTLYITPGVKPTTNRDLKSIIEEVRTYIRKRTKQDHLIEMIVQNYKTESSPFLRILPRILKDLTMPIFYKAIGVDLFSGALSNIGNVDLPKGLTELVKEVHFVLGPCPISKSNLAVTGYQDTLTLNFGRVIKDAKVERKFLRKLVEMGIDVTVKQGGR